MALPITKTARGYMLFINFMIAKKLNYLFIPILMFLVANTSLATEGEKMKALEKNRTTVTRYFEEVWNQGKLDILDEILSPEYINHNPGFENPKPGPEGLKPIVSAIRTGFPDLKYIIEKLIVTDDYVAAYVTMTGTHTGVFFGIEPTGKKIEVHQMQFERIFDGKMIEHWRVTDDLSMMKQLDQIK